MSSLQISLFSPALALWLQLLIGCCSLASPLSLLSFSPSHPAYTLASPHTWPDIPPPTLIFLFLLFVVEFVVLLSHTHTLTLTHTHTHSHTHTLTLSHTHSLYLFLVGWSVFWHHLVDLLLERISS